MVVNLHIKAFISRNTQYFHAFPLYTFNVKGLKRLSCFQKYPGLLKVLQIFLVLRKTEEPLTPLHECRFCISALG